MINLTRLYLGKEQPADALRYGCARSGEVAYPTAAARHPVVVWNITRRCNLRCIHCYADSEPKDYTGELNFGECCAVVDDLEKFRVPAVLLSGGEPLTHPHFFDLANYAVGKGLRLTLSTNGTLLTLNTARRLRDIGFSYVGISLDGIGKTHDDFRGRVGAFDAAVAAFRHCRAVGQKSGLRLTLTRHTIESLPAILDFIESENIERVCFYHLVFSGRGSGLQLVEQAQLRKTLDTILDKICEWDSRGITREVLTVDQPADGVHIYRRLLEENPARAEQVRSLLEWNGGGTNSSGVGIACIGHTGEVHPDQFWQTLSLGNVKKNPFSQIWTTSQNPLLAGLRNRLPLLKGRCARCPYQTLCGGGFRVRALQATGDPWAEDPACGIPL